MLGCTQTDRQTWEPRGEHHSCKESIHFETNVSNIIHLLSTLKRDKTSNKDTMQDVFQGHGEDSVLHCNKSVRCLT